MGLEAVGSLLMLGLSFVLSAVIGAELAVVAVAATVAYLVLVPLLAALTARMPRAKGQSALRLRYREGEGVLRSVLTTATGLGYCAAVLDISQRDDRTIEVHAQFAGKHSRQELVTALSALDGVVGLAPDDEA